MNLRNHITAQRRIVARTPLPLEVTSDLRVLGSVTYTTVRSCSSARRHVVREDPGGLLGASSRERQTDGSTQAGFARVRRISLIGDQKRVEDQVLRVRSTGLRESVHCFSDMVALIDSAPNDEVAEQVPDLAFALPEADRAETSSDLDGGDFWICNEAMESLYTPAGRECGWLDDARAAAGVQQFRHTSFGSIEGANPGWSPFGQRRGRREVGLYDYQVPEDWSDWAVFRSESSSSRVSNRFSPPSTQSAHGISMASVLVADGRQDGAVVSDRHTGMARSAGAVVYDDATGDNLPGGGEAAVRGLSGADVFVTAKRRYMTDEVDDYGSTFLKSCDSGHTKRCNFWGGHERNGPGRAYADQVDATFADSGLQVFFSAGNAAGNCYTGDRYSIPLGRSAFSSIAAGAAYATPTGADYTTRPELTSTDSELKRAAELQGIASIGGYECGNASGPTGDGRNYPLMLGYSSLCGVAMSEVAINWHEDVIDEAGEKHDVVYSLTESGLTDVYYLFDGTSAAVAQLGGTYLILKEWLDLEFPDLGPEDAPFYRVTFLNMGDRTGTFAADDSTSFTFFSYTGLPRHAGFGKPRLRVLDSCHFNDGSLEYHAFHLHAAGDTYVASLREAGSILPTLPAALARFRIAMWCEVNSADVEDYDDRCLAMVYLQRREGMGDWETIAVTWTGDEFVPDRTGFDELYNTDRLIRRDPHANIAVDRSWGHYTSVGFFPDTPDVEGGGEWRVLVVALVVPRPPQKVHLSILWETGEDASLAENRGVGWSCAMETGRP